MAFGRPKGGRTLVATDSEYTSGAFIGTPNKIALLSGEKAQGWHPEKAPPAQKFNQLQYESSHWGDYVSDVTLLNWHEPIILDTAGNALDLNYARQPNGDNNLNQVADIFWSDITTRWVVCGVDTAGHFMVADHNLAQDISSGAGTPPKVAFGCGTGSRTLLFNGDFRSTGNAIEYIRSGSGALNGGTKLTLPGTTGNKYAGKAIDISAILSNGVVVCGGRNGNHVVWYSSDNGGGFTEQTVGAVTNSTSMLDRIVLGANHGGLTRRLITFTNDTSGNGGNKLWYTDDGPATGWTSTTFGSYDGILDIVYLPNDITAPEDGGQYVLVANGGEKLLISTDPVGGSVTELLDLTGSGTLITAFNAYGDAIVFAATNSGNTTLNVIPYPGAIPKLILRTWDPASGLAAVQVGSIGVNLFGQFAYSCAGVGPVQISLKTFSL